jgi:hypothetical protein
VEKLLFELAGQAPAHHRFRRHGDESRAQGARPARQADRRVLPADRRHPEQFGELVRTEVERYGKMIRAVGIKPN